MVHQVESNENQAGLLDGSKNKARHYNRSVMERNAER